MNHKSKKKDCVRSNREATIIRRRWVWFSGSGSPASKTSWSKRFGHWTWEKPTMRWFHLRYISLPDWVFLRQHNVNTPPDTCFSIQCSFTLFLINMYRCDWFRVRSSNVVLEWIQSPHLEFHCSTTQRSATAGNVVTTHPSRLPQRDGPKESARWEVGCSGTESLCNAGCDVAGWGHSHDTGFVKKDRKMYEGRWETRSAPGNIRPHFFIESKRCIRLRKQKLFKRFLLCHQRQTNQNRVLHVAVDHSSRARWRQQRGGFSKLACPPL